MELTPARKPYTGCPEKSARFLSPEGFSYFAQQKWKLSLFKVLMGTCCLALLDKARWRGQFSTQHFYNV